jgi:iron complex outermembrane receptor protein
MVAIFRASPPYMHTRPSPYLTVIRSFCREGIVLMRIFVASTALCLSVAGLSAASEAEAAIKKNTTIAAQPLEPALQVLARQWDFQVVYRSEVVGDLRTSGAAGDLTAIEALEKLLNGTGLTYQYLDPQTVTIVPLDAQTPPPRSEKPAITEKAAPLSAEIVKTSEAKPRRGFLRLAQAATPSSSSEQASAESAAASSTLRSEMAEEIVVTGTRLQVGGYDAPTPVTVIGADTLIDRAPANVLEVLNQVPAFRQAAQTANAGRGSVIPTGVQGLADLRGLGAARTLTLVDSQRFTPGNMFGIVDTNMIPNSMIEQVEVVTGGASAAYGSDAVGGVVNFRLKDRMQGLTSSVQVGQSEYGDQEQIVASLGGGTDFADGRLHGVFGIDYARNHGAFSIYDRPYGRKEPSLLATGAVGGPTRPAGTPAQVWSNGVELAAFTPGGIISAGPLRGTAFDDAGNPYNFQYGTLYGNNMIGSTANYGNNPQGYMTLGNPFKRTTFYTKFTYDLTDETSLWASANYGHFSFEGRASPPTNIGPIRIAINNPFIPASVQARIAANNSDADPNNNVASQTVGKIFSTVGGNWTRQANDTYRAAVGIKGSAFGDWNWDGYAAYGKTKEDFRFNGIATNNIYAASHAVRDANGNIVCGSTATNLNIATPAAAALVQPGCVPFNIFGVTSRATDRAAYDYMFQTEQSDQQIKQLAVGVNLSGSPFSNWAGPVAVGVGAEYRDDELDVVSTPYGVIGGYFTTAQSDFGGDSSVKEGYVEVGFPLLKDLGPVVDSLDLNVAGRYTDYEIVGSVKTWKGGVTYDINDNWRLRATRSHDIRAPTLYDLFNINPPNILVGLNNPFTGTLDTGFFVTAGNPDLQEETANSTTAGIVFQSDAGFRASLDYYDIDIDDLIQPGVASVPQIINRCFAGDAQFCSAIQFNPNGTIGTVFLRGTNVGSMHSDGFDLELEYSLESLPFGMPGSLNFRLLGSHTREHSLSTAAGKVDYVGSGSGFYTSFVPVGGGVPEWHGSLAITYELEPVTTQLQLTGFSDMKFSPLSVGPGEAGYNPNLPNSISKNVFQGMIYANLNLRYAMQVAGIETEWFGIVNNVTNREPPEYALNAFSFGTANYYDTIGRSYQLGVRMKL